MRKFIFIGVLVIFLISACASNKFWSKPGGTEAEYRRDCYECERDAAMMPGSPAPYRPAIYADTPYGTTQSASDDLFALSHSLSQKAAKITMYERCMQSKGYILTDK